MKKIAVIGGGASGMVAAITAARNGASAVIYEQNDRIGKKLLATGNGKCNLSNLNMVETAFYSDTEGFAGKILEQFDVVHTIAFFEELGLCIKDKSGYLYPLSEQATAVLDVLRIEIEHLCIPVKTQEVIKSIQKAKDHSGYYVGGSLYDAVILACGSKASLKSESKVYGYTLSKEMGHSIITLQPSLVQLRCKESFFKSIAGVRMDAEVVLYADNYKICRERGEVQMTDYGISGIPVFQISRFAAKALAEMKKVFVKIDFLPQFAVKELEDFMRKRLQKHSYKTAESFFYGILPKKIILMLLKESKLSAGRTIGEYPEEELIHTILSWKVFPVTVKNTNPFENAQVCSGGVDVKEITYQMESKLQKGLFFAGEMLDVDGKCGGYNLQWAWSSGYVAGLNAARFEG